MGASTRGEWLRQPTNPEPERDLGYKLTDWDCIRARTRGEEHLMFLPDDEELLRKEAFVVVAPDDVCTLSAHR